MKSLLGKPAPDFKSPDQNGTTHRLSDYRGKWVLLYFYPKDMTPGCTAEAQCFRDRLNDLKVLGIEVLGVSTDSVVSHKKFAETHHLNFPLLADTEKKVVNQYGVWIEKSMYGKNYMGIQRDSFLINKEGIIIKHYIKVKPEKHVEEVIGDVKELS